MIRYSLATVLLSIFVVPGPTALRSRLADEVSDLVQEIESARDEADPEKLAQLAGFRTRAAAEGLIQLYERMSSIYMKREVVRALARFDGVADAEQIALQKLMDVATASEDPELRAAALDGIGACQQLGKSFLEMIVESAAEDDVREQAMRLHVARAAEADRDWYRKLYEQEKERESKKTRKRKKKEDEDAERQLLVHRLATVRELAFDALRPALEIEELEAACEDPWPGIRGLALDSLHQKDVKRAEKWAREVFGDLEERAATRATAARILAETEGARFADELIETCGDFITPMALRLEIAEILAGFGEERVDKELIKQLNNAKKDYEKLWALHAVRGLKDPKLYKSIEGLLEIESIQRLLEIENPGEREKVKAVLLAAVRVLGERREKEPIEHLMEVLEESEDADLTAATLEALSAIRGADAEWLAKLAEYAKSAERDVRNAAIVQLGKTGDVQYLETIAAGLSNEQWSTRYAALRALESLRTKEAVGLIVARMGEEQGRMLYEFADALFRLTGMPYRLAPASWKSWWEQSKDGFQVLSAEELAKRVAEDEERRLRQVTKVNFFGIRILSERVIFIVDISGSMNESMRARFEGEEVIRTRIDVAKEELAKSIDSLDRTALFNIVIFSDGVDRWLEGGVAGSTGKTREEAKAWIERLGAGGATNLYDAVQTAFEDPDVDTIFILSDGEPTSGGQTDPEMIRQHVKTWNEHRGIVIHSVSVGLQLDVLRWLAEDTGGKYVQLF